MTIGKTDSYCNQKFWWLNVDLTRKQQYSCCSATPADIDIPWLSKNSGKLFNTPLLHQERKAMLNNEPVASCYDNCVRPENQGLVSRRYIEQGNIKTHTEIESSPTLVNVIIGSTCNLTCVYCCKQYSSAWLRDIEQLGPYFDTNRFKIWPNDQVKKHFDIQADSDYKLLLDELALLSPDTIHISGGEPFLYNNLYNLVSESTAKTIKINTGLGVDPVRFQQQINKLKDIKNIEILVSGETVGKLYELVRYGNEFERFETNLQTVQQSGLKHTMVSVISNLTVLGIVDFYRRYQDVESYFVLCNDPEFLSVNVLDDVTKAIVIEQIQKLDHPVKSTILDNIVKPATLQQHKDFSKYIQEFASRRNIALNVLPDSLINWIHSA
jgi:organic radical activating enzyme